MANRVRGIWLILLASAASPLCAQGITPALPPRQASNDDVIIVTAVPRGQNRLDSSISASVLSPGQIQVAAPRSAAEMFRALPGIRSESSGGEGNANISVRGLPLATGGSKYLQLQEDGLPILQFGDITFGNADIFLRADLNLQRIEAVRGGSSSTLASNSPGGVINLISRTGDREGGAIQLSGGIDYEEYRIDADYGGRIGEDWTWHAGGFYRRGEGPRKAGYDAQRGGQLKANLTRKFSNGFVRVYVKYLNDRTPSYLPTPVRVTGSDHDPRYRSLPGFSVRDGTFYSRHNRAQRTLGADNRPVTDDLGDGMHPVVKQIGLEARVEPGEGWTISERFRFADISGRFIAPFPALVGDAATVAAALGGPGATLRHATGPLAGQAIAAPAGLNGNGLLAQNVVFDTRLNQLDNITNDLRAIRDISIGEARLSLTGGLFLTRQRIDTDWTWSSVVSEVRGDGRAALVDIRTAAGVPQTDRGTYGYGASFFGNCCRRSYDARYDIAAPFAAFNYGHGGWTLAGSLRWDNGRVRGRVAGTDLGIGGPATSPVDVDGDGAISAAEARSTATPAIGAPVRYRYDYLSWSTGVNYRLAYGTSLFARYSRGGRANADRILFGPALRIADGGLSDRSAAVDFVRQAEAGLKYQQRDLALFATLFHATVEESNFEATSQRFLDRRYRAYGLEMEGSYQVGGFSITGAATWTHARITRDRVTPANEGNRPRRQARVVYSVTPQYQGALFTIGANLVGTGSSYAQDNEGLKLPAYAQVNAFVSVRPTAALMLSLSANNLFDVQGFTEAEEGSIPANGIVRARSINGRTMSVAAKLTL
ncbi:TonB-dependent receptor domain-containing protein [Rhizorhabdus dicambivorans]|uniref:TonB-dependent receptor n=1 Tax=Rhizorhabdus dicambivorans TaxID=1850238 RepID=A0A2A4G2S1_9SPHN|nr:TonB-dependent receptor [Rhizorhabdus dicambivorans]ATE65058.1 TonB-dependent receptor [Rhizorhabdus dicambivorans]PCE44332.1 TonB-dependent receptor [Rhizorhabdus dicambivorans]